MDLLIFDCDGVLVDSEIIAQRVMERELTARLPGVDVAALVRSTDGMTTAAVLERAQAKSGRTLPATTLEDVRAAVDQALRVELKPLPGVRSALKAVSTLKAVASNSALRRLRQSLNQARLTAVFGDRVFSADCVATPKPAPDLYLHTARTLGVDPAHCLVVEDSVIGVTAARLAGMTVIGFTGASHVAPDQGNRLRRVGASVVIDHMDLLPGLVASWTSGEV